MINSCGATGNGMNKNNKGQRKLEGSGKQLLPAVEGHSLEKNRVDYLSFCVIVQCSVNCRFACLAKTLHTINKLFNYVRSYQP